MTTKKLVPRASGEGAMGVADNAWGEAYYDTGNFNKGLFVSGHNITQVIAETVTQGDLGGEWTRNGLDIYYNGGNVGIGTTHPEADLHVTGSVKVDGDLAVDGTLTTINSTTVSVGGLLDLRQADGGVQLQMGRTNSSVGEAWMGADSNGFHLGVGPYGVENTVTNPNGFSVDTFGRVGIGTSTPVHPLEVKKDVDDWVSRIYNTRSDSSSAGLLVRSDATALHDSSVFGVYADGGYKFIIKSDGNVGIGAASPSNLLELRTEPNSGGMADIALYSDGANSNATSSIFLGQSSTRRAEITAIRLSSGNDHELAFSTNLGAAPPVEAMRIDSAGNVGIGATSPGAKLDIEVQEGDLLKSKVLNLLAAKGIITQGTTTLYVDQDLTSVFAAGDTIKIEKGIYTITSLGPGAIELSSNYLGATHTTNTADLYTVNDALCIDSKGYVGIGTTSPSSRLQIEGGSNNDSQLRLTNTYNTGDISDFLLTPMYGTNQLQIRSATGTGVIALNGDGNVGIGTTTPGAKLDVQTNSFGNIARLGTTDGTNNPRMFIGSSATGMYIKQSHTTGAGGFDFQNSVGGSKLFIEEGGNVGIGTTNPAVKLDVQGSNANGDVRLALANTSDGQDAYTLLLLGNDEYPAGSAGFRRYSSTHPMASVFDIANLEVGKHITFSTRSLTYAQERMRINSDGNVGIGTTNPKFKLDVVAPATMVLGGSDDNLGATNNFNKSSRVGGIAYTNSDFPVNMMVHTSTASDSNLYFGWGTGTMHSPTKIIFGTAGDTTTLSNSASTSRMFIHSNGNVSIGDDIDSNKLYVNGNIFANGTITPASDDRVKHNEQTIVGAIEILGKLTPKKYIKTTEMYDADHDFKLDADGNPVDSDGESVEHHIEAGVIAQQVLTVDELAFAVSPEGVDEDGKVTSPHGLDYNSLFTYAIAAIQEQQQLIEDLKSRIETLENK